MSAIEISPREIPRAWRDAAKGARKAMETGIVRSAHRGKAFLISETDRKAITDMGLYKASFAVEPGGSSGAVAILENTAPHAGIIELGARPHKVNREGIEALTAWAKRKLAQGPVQAVTSATTGRTRFVKPKMSDAAARSIAFAIAKTIEKRGQKGRYVFRDAMPTLSRFMNEEIERSIREFSQRGRP